MLCPSCSSQCPNCATPSFVFSDLWVTLQTANSDIYLFSLSFNEAQNLFKTTCISVRTALCEDLCLFVSVGKWGNTSGMLFAIAYFVADRTVVLVHPQYHLGSCSHSFLLLINSQMRMARKQVIHPVQSCTLLFVHNYYKICTHCQSGTNLPS